MFVFDPTDADGYHVPNGKQTLTRSHIFYVPCSGIWQTVWLESVPSIYVTGMDIAADADGNGEIQGTIQAAMQFHSLQQRPSSGL